MKQTIIGLAAIVLVLASCKKDSGSISYTYNKGIAKYANIEDVRNTPLVGSTRAIKNAGKIYIGGDVLLIGEKNVGIHVFDNSNPANPVNVSFIQLPYNEEFTVKDNFIYAETHYDLVKIDISSLSQPVLADRENYAFGQPMVNNQGQVLIGFDYVITTENFEINSPEAAALKKSSSLYFDYMQRLIPQADVPSSFVGTEDSKGTLNKIAVKNNHVYVVTANDLYTFSDNVGVDYVQKQTIGSNIETIYPENNKLFIGTKTSMIVMDITSPSSPSYTSTYTHPLSCDPVLPNGNVAYLTLRTGDFGGCSGDVNELQVIDITNINSPNKIDAVAMNSPYGMTISNDLLFVGEGDNGIKVLDITNPRNPVEVYRNTTIKAFDVVKHPSIADALLVTGRNGLEQYTYNNATKTFALLSYVNY